MGCDTGNAHCLCVLLEHLPDDFLTKALACNSISAIHRSEDVCSPDGRSGSPSIDCDFYPSRQRRCANAAMLRPQIHNAPAAITLLEVRERKCRNLRPAESAPKKNGEDGAIALAPHGADIGRVEQALHLAH